MKSKILLSLLFLLTALSLYAVPARPGKFRHVQPDGSTITLVRHGDEWGHWLTDGAGNVVRKDADGFYRPVPASKAESIRRQAATRRAEARRRRVPRASGIALDKKHFLVILVAFSDLDFKTPDANTAFGNLLNQQGYSANGGKGSARDFYYENSRGKFEPVFDVYGPVKLSHDKAYYGGNDSDDNDLRPEQAVAEHHDGNAVFIGFVERHISHIAHLLHGRRRKDDHLEVAVAERARCLPVIGLGRLDRAQARAAAFDVDDDAWKVGACHIRDALAL